MALDDYGAKPRRMWKPALCWVGGSLAFLYVGLIVLLTIYEGRLIFLPPKTLPAATPADSGVTFMDLHIAVDGKSYAHAWWIPSQDSHAKTLIYFHGNAGALEYETYREAAVLRETGANLLLVDYRGYGTSSALHPSGATMREDALASLHCLEQELHIPATEIVIFGWSIGSGVATQLALDAPDVAGMILLSPITSVADVANEGWVFRYPLRPSQWLRHDNDFAIKDKIALIHVPVLIMVGTADALAPPWMATELFARANEPKRLRFIEGATHNDVMETRDGTFLREVRGFIQSLK